MESKEILNVSTAMNNFGVAFKELAEAVAAAFNRIVEFAKEFLERSNEKKHLQQRFSLDLSRPAIIHQVISRKPKHMIRKIIH